MVPLRRLALLPFVLAALCLAGPALAKPGSELEVWQFQAGLGKPADIDVALHVASDRPAASDVAIYVPGGYGLDLSSPVGRTIGLTSVTMWRGTHELFGRGTIVVADPKQAQPLSCDPGPHNAVWLLKIAIDGRRLQFPVLVDGRSDRAIQSVLVDPGTPPGGRPSAYRLHLCLAPTSATHGLRLIWVDLDTPAFRNPAVRQTYEWDAVVQSYGAGGTPDPSTRFEVRSMVSLPQAVAFTSRYDRARDVVVISGTVTWTGTPRANVRVFLGWSAKPQFTDNMDFGSTVTDANGRFSYTQHLTKPGWLRASVQLEGMPECGVSSYEIPCVYMTISPPPDAFRRLVLPTRR